ncbi:MAG TPA: hypothetical protein PKG48_07105 [Bacteroidales bacterium]|nr:hypothetical protein [Bacteroidales bacterium]HPS63272.1 hypothetical protein [Bacteroidales bacterium]
MRPLSGLLPACCILTVLLSCSGSGQEKKPAPVTPSDKARVIRHIPVVADTTQSYALYLPGRKPFLVTGAPNGVTRFPVIIAFDPHGDGSLPLTRYQDLAERYGFILAGSNNSRNGLPGDQAGDIATRLIRDLLSRYPVDSTRIWLIGFSGGARVASSTAMYLQKVQGVIGCGAGFGRVERPPAYRFDYIGLAGTADFNVHEVQGLDKPLTDAGYRHFIATFPGKHEWPPVEIMENTFRMIVTNAIRDGQLTKNDSLVQAISHSLALNIRDCRRINDLTGGVEVCRWALTMLDGLTETGLFRDEKSSLEQNPMYASQVAYRSQLVEKEENARQELVTALQQQGLNWWRTRIARELAARGRKVNPKDRKAVEDTLMSYRLMSFLSLYCYMNATGALNRQDEAASIKIVSVYGMCDPENPEPDYMKAILHARRGENQEAVHSLEQAAGKGFTDRPRLEAQPEFRALAGTPGWKELMTRIK